jgi:hypothetical protein
MWLPSQNRNVSCSRCCKTLGQLLLSFPLALRLCRLLLLQSSIFCFGVLSLSSFVTQAYYSLMPFLWYGQSFSESTPCMKWIFCASVMSDPVTELHPYSDSMVSFNIIRDSLCHLLTSSSYPLPTKFETCFTVLFSSIFTWLYHHFNSQLHLYSHVFIILVLYIFVRTVALAEGFVL